MKLSLVVASGLHAGKAIPITVPQFVIGRDPQCQLRPASSAISKRHCAIFVRGKEVFIRDFGSTNGTFVNDKLVEGEGPAKPQPKKKSVVGTGNTSDAAAEILKRYQRRPRTG